jgi:hypothetical protein
MMAKSKYDNCCKVEEGQNWVLLQQKGLKESMGLVPWMGNGQGSKDNKVLSHHNLIISQQLASNIPTQ